MRFFFLFLLLPFDLWSQVSTSDFDLKSNVCLGEQLRVQNNSQGALQYNWDFCSGDLGETPTATNFLTTAGSPFKVEIVEQDGQYFGFYLTQANGRLNRLDFGTNPNSNPIPLNLGGLGVNSTSWFTIEIVKDGQNYYGFINDYANRIYRISFGNNIANQPSTAEIIYQNNLLNSPIDLVALEDNGAKFVFVANIADNRIIRLAFPDSFVDAANQIQVSYFDVTGSGGLSGISFIKDLNTWYAVTTSFGSAKISKIEFTNDLNDSSPIISLISGLPFTPSGPVGVSIAFENDKYYAFVQSAQVVSNLYKIEFGNSMNNPPNSNSVDLGNLGVLSNIWGFSMHKIKSRWMVFSSVNAGQNIFKIDFPNRCFSDIEFSTGFEPTLISRNVGSYTVSLSTLDVNGISHNRYKTIDVSSDISPIIDFTTQNICANHDINFVSENSSGDVTDYNWDFGDTNTSMLQNPVHQFDMAGDYEIDLKVTASNGCNNQTTQTLKIYNPPVASFTLPVGLVCTNNEFLFENNTTDSFDGNLSYLWFVNNSSVATTRNLIHAFTTSGNQEIKLQSAIPGCMSESAQTLSNIQVGAVVDFLKSGHCEDEVVSFTNNSMGDIVSYQWDFGDGQSSAATNPTHTYIGKGDFQVALHVSTSNGCVSTNSEPITIYSKPQPNFSIDLPPFSCAGSPSQFNDLTPPLTDSNIATWTWHFGDAANGTSSQKNPTYIYTLAGDYQVSLETETNFGCTNTIQKTITISQAPVVDFTHDASCLNQGTQFQDASGSNVKAWLWSIQNNTYTSQNPIHSFNTTGDQSATLAVTGNNNCVSQVSKTLFIPTPVNIDFTAQSTCASKPSFFQETSTAGSDPATSWRWDFGGQQALGSPVQHVFQNTGNYNVRLYSTRQSGCVYSVSKSISVVAPPVAQFSMSPESGAAPLAVGFTNTSSGASSFLWKFNDANNSTSTLFSPSFTYSALGEYPVDLIARNANGCSDTLQKIVQVVVPQINLAMTELTLFNNGDGSLRANVTIRNDGNLTIQNPDVYLNLAGKAQVKEKISGPVLPGQSITRTLATSILPTNLKYACAEVFVNGDTNQFDNEKCINLVDETVFISPYPNPANEIVYLEWVNTNLESLDLVIYNSLGQPVLSKTYSGLLTGLNQVELYVGNLAEGIYFATYITGNRTFSTRFSIVR